MTFACDPFGLIAIGFLAGGFVVGAAMTVVRG